MIDINYPLVLICVCIINGGPYPVLRYFQDISASAPLRSACIPNLAGEGSGSAPDPLVSQICLPPVGNYPVFMFSIEKPAISSQFFWVFVWFCDEMRPVPTPCGSSQKTAEFPRKSGVFGGSCLLVSHRGIGPAGVGPLQIRGF